MIEFQTEFALLDRWDISAVEAATFREAHPDFLPLSACVVEAGKLVRPSAEPDKEWPVYGVDNVRGVSFSHWQRGSEFHQPYKRISAGDFIHNPTRANVGSFGRASDIEVDAITSPDYQVWRVVDGYLPEFLEILIKTKPFLRLVEIHRVGAVKRRLFVANLKEIVLPRPSKEYQQAMVDEYKGAQLKRGSLLKEARDAQESLGDYLAARLGFTDEMIDKGGFAEGIEFQDLDRWDLPFFRTGYMLLEDWLDSFKNSYTLGDAAIFRLDGWTSDDFPDGEFPYIEIGSVDKIKGIVAATPVPVGEAPSRARFRVRRNDILISMTRPYMGKIAVVGNEFDGAVCSSGFSVISGTADYTTLEYLFLIIRSPLVLRQFERRMSGGAYPAINQIELEKVRIPIPSEEEQTDLIEKGSQFLQTAQQKISQAEEVTKQALEPFERLILGP
jgi:type I restriction enzyme S subunit